MSDLSMCDESELRQRLSQLIDNIEDVCDKLKPLLADYTNMRKEADIIIKEFERRKISLT